MSATASDNSDQGMVCQTLYKSFVISLILNLDHTVTCYIVRKSFLFPLRFNAFMSLARELLFLSCFS